MKNKKLRISINQSFRILFPYVKSKLFYQIKSISFIIVYLAFFQVVVLKTGINNILTLIVGLIFVTIGLTVFMEGLMIGIMPLGEFCGKTLPRKISIGLILFFGFIIGIVATLAEPAISVLNSVGLHVTPWKSPLLFSLLNKHSFSLIIAISIGVGLAVLFGILRFIYNLSLKPFIFSILPPILILSIVMVFDKKLSAITGLAWDTGGITTGPVTVPLIIALGIGISKVIGDKSENGSGLGVVTLASSFPILAVLIFGLFVSFSVPDPDTEIDFFKKNHDLSSLFKDKDREFQYIMKNCSEEVRDYYVLINNINLEIESEKSSKLEINQLNSFKYINFIKNALLAIVPLSFFLIFIVFYILRERIKYFDEIILGVILAIIGMALFNIGIELGLSKLGSQVGNNLPLTYTSMPLREKTFVIKNFDENIVHKAFTDKGEMVEFIYIEESSWGDTRYNQYVYDSKFYDKERSQYTVVPVKKPVTENKNLGFFILIIFAILMGYTVTLAEPALVALGITLEELTIGTFKKKLLINSVAIGVGVGMGFGVFRLIFDVPLIWLLVPPYLFIFLLTILSNETFVNIAWDSAGVTTGPITVPLVVSMGIGIGSVSNIADCFGILALASTYPILSVLIVGMFVEYKRKKNLKESYDIEEDFIQLGDDT